MFLKILCMMLSDVVGKGEVCGDPVQDNEVHDGQSEEVDDSSEPL